MDKLSEQEEKELTAFIKDWLKIHRYSQKDLANELKIKSGRTAEIMLKIKDIDDNELKTDCIILQNAIYDVMQKYQSYTIINPDSLDMSDPDPILAVINKMTNTECFNSMWEKYAPEKFVAHEFFDKVKALKTESSL